MAWISTPRGLYGESGIRTHGTLASTHAFQACTLGHSVISPSSMDGARAPAYTEVQAGAQAPPGGRSAVAYMDVQADAQAPRMERGRTRTWMYKAFAQAVTTAEARSSRAWKAYLPNGYSRTHKRPPGLRIHTRLAERVGFEPTEPQAAQRFSRPPDSTALASLQAHGWAKDVRVQGRTSGRPERHGWRKVGVAIEGQNAAQERRRPKHKVARCAIRQGATDLFVPKRIRTSDL